MADGVLRPMLKKWRVWLPLFAMVWFWSLAFYEHRINISANPSASGVTEKFGCSTLYYDPGDRSRAEHGMYPFELDCYEPVRIRIFAIVNLVPLIIGAALSALLRAFRRDEVTFNAVLVSSVLLVFWWLVGSYIDWRRKRFGP